MKKILYIICSILLFVSCAKDVELPNNNESSSAKGDYKISAYVDSEATKVDIDDTVIKWKAGDYITVAEIGKNDTFNSIEVYMIDEESISEDGKSADFYGRTLEADKKYVAVNSWANVANDQEYYQSLGIVGMLEIGNMDYSQVENDKDLHVESDWRMISKPFSHEENYILTIGFENISSYMELNISMEDKAEYDIKSISFSTPTQMFMNSFYLNNSCEVVYSNTTNRLMLNIEEEPTISNSKDFTVYLPFIPNDKITEIEGDFTVTINTTDSKSASVTIPAKVLSKGKLYTKDLAFPTPTNMVAVDKAALIEFYNSMNGDNWIYNDKWCSDAPLNEWYGVSTNENGRVTSLNLNYNALTGTIPESIGDITDLVYIDLSKNNLSSDVFSIPNSIKELTSLAYFNLRDNYLNCDIAAVDPIFDITSLITLDLSSNKFTGNFPERYGNLTSLNSISLYNNCLTGELPASIANLKDITFIDLRMNKISGSLPDYIGSFEKLKGLYFSENLLTGSIPESIGNLTNLEEITLSDNDLSGSIPESFNQLTNLKEIYLNGNKLEGSIPTNIKSSQYWNQWAWDILCQKQDYNFNSDFEVFLEPTTISTIDNETINTEELFKVNNLTCVCYCSTTCPYSVTYLSTLKTMYESYYSDKFEIILLTNDCSDDETTVRNYITDNDIPGYVCMTKGTDFNTFYTNGDNRIKYMPTFAFPTYAFVDSEGKIVFSEYIYPFADRSTLRENATRDFLEEYFGKPASGNGESTDYSKDGEVITLNQATVGTGINLVIVGDGFIDKDMETGGKYETRMREAMDHFFSEEPYKSFKNRYNVYAVKAVSQNEGINNTDDTKETVFETEFGEGTAISGNDNKVFEYAFKVPSITSTNDLTVITVLNSPKYAGTCYMYGGNNAAIAYCPIVSYNDEDFRQIVTHEAGGHGFAKLLDEYTYEGTIPSERADYFTNVERPRGWGANVDITSDPEQIQWAHMLSDSRYVGLVGIYEGAMTYMKGAYRPTDESIMRYNVGHYNAPSREEIYRRIMEISGSTYNYNEFTQYDAINRTAAAQAYNTAQNRKVDKANFVPLSQPVIIQGSPKAYK